MSKIKVLELFKPLFNAIEYKKQEHLEEYDKAHVLRDIMDDIDSFGDEDQKLKKLGYKLMSIKNENGEYYEENTTTIVLKHLKTKKLYSFEIYDNGAIASDAVTIKSEYLTEVKAKKKIVYV